MAQIQKGRKTRLLDFVRFGPCVDPTYTHEIVTARKCALVIFFQFLVFTLHERSCVSHNGNSLLGLVFQLIRIIYILLAHEFLTDSI